MDYLVLGKTNIGNETYLPDTIIETLQNGNEKEKAMLVEYLSFYSKIKASGV